MTRWYQRLLHRLTGGRVYAHTLQGGWCPVCGAVYYPRYQGKNEGVWR